MVDRLSDEAEDRQRISGPEKAATSRFARKIECGKSSGEVQEPISHSQPRRGSKRDN